MGHKQTQVRNVIYGEVEGTGADLIIPLPGKPVFVQLSNIDATYDATMFHYRGMADDSGIKISSKTPVGTNANESAHTHAVALDSGSSAAGSSHVHAVGSIVCAESVVNPEWAGDIDCCTKPVIALTHNADPSTNLGAQPLYITEAQGNAIKNCGVLESTTESNADVLGETADGVGGGVSASCRFFVKDNDSPAGVKIYVNESSSDQLEFISPTESDAYIIMPYEIVAGGMPGYAVAVKVHHNASADSGVELEFDDNGAADAQLCFVDTGGTGGVIPAADITVIGPGWMDGTAGCVGIAEAQVTSGSVAAEAAHTHGPGSLADAASGAGSAHTHTFTGTEDSSVDYVSSNGITLDEDAIKVGADTSINVLNETIKYVIICS